MKTEFRIIIETNLKRRRIDGEDVTKDIERVMHQAFQGFVHDMMAGNFGIDEMEERVLHDLDDNGILPKGLKTLDEFGSIKITTTQEKKERET